jgi:uncharacterized membrane protein HdeD (DUF308 family)
MTTLTSFHFGTEAKRGIGSVWGWLVALGVALVALGALAFYNLPAATMVSVYAIGILMLIAAAAKLAAAFVVRSWGGLWLLLSALLYGAAGVLAIANPTLGASALTLALAFALIFSGVTRISWSFALRALSGWGWLTASGIVSVLAGIVFIAGWPANTVYLLGMVLAIDLTFQGATAVGWGFAIKDLTK